MGCRHSPWWSYVPAMWFCLLLLAPRIKIHSGASLNCRFSFFYTTKYKNCNPGASPIRILYWGASLNYRYYFILYHLLTKNVFCNTKKKIWFRRLGIWIWCDFFVRPNTKKEVWHNQQTQNTNNSLLSIWTVWTGQDHCGTSGATVPIFVHVHPPLISLLLWLVWNFWCAWCCTCAWARCLSCLRRRR